MRTAESLHNMSALAHGFDATLNTQVSFIAKVVSDT